MRPEALALLWDAVGATERIERFIAGRAFDDYLADDQLRSAVERQLEIVGRATGEFRGGGENFSSILGRRSPKYMTGT